MPRQANRISQLCKTCGSLFQAWPSKIASGRKYCSYKCRPPTPIRDPFERFQNFVYPEPNSGCWLWAGADGGGGYGTFFDGKQVVKAHRAAWVFHQGSIPGGMSVLHRCDNPYCVNPDHLFLGTHAHNMLDKKVKGRSRVPFGENHKQSVLRDDDIRVMRTSTETNTALGRRFGVSNVLVSQIRRRKAWKHVA